MKIDVSVIMSVKDDHKDYLNKSIESILNQTFKNFEFIIIADGSNNKTISKLQKYSSSDNRIKLYKQVNIGLTKSLNKGLYLANSNYILRQDYDDISEPNRIEKLFSFLKKHKDIAVCASNYFKIDATGKKIFKFSIPNPSRTLKNFNYYNPIIHPSVMLRKNIILELNGYNESYRLSQDYELWSRVNKKFKIYYLNLKLYNLRVHKESISFKNNYIQRKNSVIISMKSKFFNSNIDFDKVKSFKTDDLIVFFKKKDIKIQNYLNSRLFTIMYDDIKITKFFSYNFSTMLLILIYYFNRPKYFLYRIGYR
tara:strand:- start:8813 stop:9742 length:930 start_codon:yes stop_codon:yes gene_type:complete